jgi:hypothetical protein
MGKAWHFIFKLNLKKDTNQKAIANLKNKNNQVASRKALSL